MEANDPGMYVRTSCTLSAALSVFISSRGMKLRRYYRGCIPAVTPASAPRLLFKVKAAGCAAEDSQGGR